MSEGHDTDIDGGSQSEKSRVNLERKSILREQRDARLRLGFAFRHDIAAVFGISLATVDLWRQNGLEMFRPGTLGAMCTTADLAAFLALKKTFKGRKKSKGKRK